MKAKLQISHDDKTIQFFNEELGVLGFTDYTSEIWEELRTINWYVNKEKFIKKEKNYIYTGSNRFGGYKNLHQIVMILWYGIEALESSYEKQFIVEHHNNDAFDCHVRNLSFAHNDINLAKAHSFDKNQPKLLQQAAVNFYKDFETQHYQITIKFTGNFFLVLNEEAILLDSIYFLHEDNFRVVFTDANRIVDELLEKGKIDFRLLSHIRFSFRKAVFYIPEEEEKIEGAKFITDKNGNHFFVPDKDTVFFFNSTLPNQDLYEDNK